MLAQIAELRLSAPLWGFCFLGIKVLQALPVGARNLFFEKEFFFQIVANLAVSEQVGALYIHCRYGCKPKYDRSGQYEVNPTGCPFTVKLNERK